MDIIQPYIEKYLQYSIVSYKNVLNLLGEEYFGKITKDAIRKQGVGNGIYFWNVLDYLRMKGNL